MKYSIDKNVKKYIESGCLTAKEFENLTENQQLNLKSRNVWELWSKDFLKTYQNVLDLTEQQRHTLQNGIAFFHIKKKHIDINTVLNLTKNQRENLFSDAVDEFCFNVGFLEYGKSLDSEGNPLKITKEHRRFLESDLIQWAIKQGYIPSVNSINDVGFNRMSYAEIFKISKQDRDFLRKSSYFIKAGFLTIGEALGKDWYIENFQKEYIGNIKTYNRKNLESNTLQWCVYENYLTFKESMSLAEHKREIIEFMYSYIENDQLKFSEVDKMSHDHFKNFKLTLPLIKEQIIDFSTAFKKTKTISFSEGKLLKHALPLIKAGQLSFERWFQLSADQQKNLDFACTLMEEKKLKIVKTHSQNNGNGKGIYLQAVLAFFKSPAKDNTKALTFTMDETLKLSLVQMQNLKNPHIRALYKEGIFTLDDLDKIKAHHRAIINIDDTVERLRYGFLSVDKVTGVALNVSQSNSTVDPIVKTLVHSN